MGNLIKRDLRDLFDSVSGGIDGSACVEGWDAMTFDELYEQVEAQNEHYYDSIFSCLEMIRVATCLHMCVVLDNDFGNIRNSLED